MTVAENGSMESFLQQESTSKAASPAAAAAAAAANPTAAAATQQQQQQGQKRPAAHADAAEIGPVAKRRKDSKSGSSGQVSFEDSLLYVTKPCLFRPMTVWSLLIMG